MIFNEVSGSFLRSTILQLRKFFCNQLSSFLDRVNTRIQEHFQEFFIKKLEFPQSPKISFNYNDHEINVTKPNNRKLALPTKTLK